MGLLHITSLAILLSLSSLVSGQCQRRVARRNPPPYSQIVQGVPERGYQILPGNQVVTSFPYEVLSTPRYLPANEVTLQKLPINLVKQPANVQISQAPAKLPLAPPCGPYGSVATAPVLTGPVPSAPVLTAPIPSAPAAYGPGPCVYPAPNPFLPAASPISGLGSPNPNLLPSALPRNNRNQFLRKIPIPPPTL